MQTNPNPTQSQQMTATGSSSQGDRSGNELPGDNDDDSEKSKLREEIEHIKREQLTDPIIMKDERSGGEPSVVPSVASSPTVEDVVTAKRIRTRPTGSESSPLTEPESPRGNQFHGKLSSDELAQIPSFGLSTETSYGRNPSVASKGGKSISGMSSMMNSHNYFGTDYDNEVVNEKCQLAQTTGLHGNTSKVVATQHRRRAWDWNYLPKVGSSVLVRTHSFNVISVPIDGEIKQILYTPLYNKNFRRMNVFLSFNMDTKPWDALIHSRKRLVSFASYTKHYLKSRTYAYQCYPFFLQGLTEEDMKTQNYVSYNASHDYTEIELIIALWRIQSQKLLFSTNSIIFSSEVIQGLLQRKTSTRAQSAVQGTVFLQQSEADQITTRPVLTEPLEEIDVLLLRGLPDDLFGWQLAYDEPNLNIVDYSLDTSPWSAQEGEGPASNETHSTSDSFQGSKIVTKKEDIERIDTDNIAHYLYDCMDRRISDLTEDVALSTAQKTSTDEGSGRQGSLADSSKKKSSHGKLGKRSGLANLFKRKHAHFTPHTTHSEPPAPTSPEGKIGGRSQSIQNAWLEDYFGKCLGNYKRIRMPTQYFLPQEAISEESDHSEEDKKAEARKAFLYNKESLQIVLPFADNVIPSIYVPWLWVELGYTRWKSLLREMYRCLIPGGFALGTVYDLKVTNTFTNPTEESTQEFPTTIEREKAYDAMTLEAMNNGIHVYPTRHIVQAFKEVGFSNIKYSIISLQTGDLATDMGCLNELLNQIACDIQLRSLMPDPSKPPKDTEPSTLFQRYTSEHLDKIDENAGCIRAVLVVAQKPRKIASQ